MTCALGCWPCSNGCGIEHGVVSVHDGTREVTKQVVHRRAQGLRRGVACRRSLSRTTRKSNESHAGAEDDVEDDCENGGDGGDDGGNDADDGRRQGRSAEQGGVQY